MDNKYFDFGTPISFGYTAQYLDNKTQTRREWKDSHAAKFVSAYDRATAAGQQLRVPAIDKAYHAGGKQIGWCVLTLRPWKEPLSSMGFADLSAEGGMCGSVDRFVEKYFKGNNSLEIWVITFQFLPLPDLDIQFICCSEREFYADIAASIANYEDISGATDDEDDSDDLEEQVKREIRERDYEREERRDRLKALTLNQSALDNPPSMSGKESHARKSLATLTSAKSDEHNTPKFLIDAARAIMGGIDLDPMSNAIANRTVRAHRIYTKSDDGLAKPWVGRIWLNPPFSLADLAVPKLIKSYESGDIFEAVLLLKSAVETKRYQALYPYPFVELNRRVNFDSPTNKCGSPFFATTLFYLGSNFPRWRQIMSDYGRVHPGARLFAELEGDRIRLLNKVAILEGDEAALCGISGLKHHDKCQGRGCDDCDFGWSRETDWEAVSKQYEQGWDKDDLPAWLNMLVGKEHYRWGEDLPEQCSEAFKLGWKLAKMEHQN